MKRLLQIGFCRDLLLLEPWTTNWILTKDRVICKMFLIDTHTCLNQAAWWKIEDSYASDIIIQIKFICSTFVTNDFLTMRMSCLNYGIEFVFGQLITLNHFQKCSYIAFLSFVTTLWSDSERQNLTPVKKSKIDKNDI